MKTVHDPSNWAANWLTSAGYMLNQPADIIQKTPWSTVIRFSTSKGDIFLKQTPSVISEPKIIKLFSERLHANVPHVIAINDEFHCFLMEDAGITLRQYLKAGDQPNLLRDAIKQFTLTQRSAENQVQLFLDMGVPDWRLDQFTECYVKLINRKELLKSQGMTERELQVLQNLSQTILKQCKQLSRYRIKETFVQPDFNTNNILLNPDTKKLTLIDLGEIAIAHPFFSLHNFIFQASIHHGVDQLTEACFENWLEIATKDELLQAFTITKKLWPIYAAFAAYRLIMSLDPQALETFNAERPNQIARHFREYIAISR